MTRIYCLEKGTGGLISVEITRGMGTLFFGL